MTARRPTSISVDPDQRRRLAAELFNYTWTLLEQDQRSQREDDLMVAAAYASRLFWEEAGTPVNHARAEWQISRACAIAGRPAEALLHAERCLQICEEHSLEPFDVGYAHEALARAAALTGDAAASAAHAALAKAAAEQVTDAEDRKLLNGDIATLVCDR